MVGREAIEKTEDFKIAMIGRFVTKTRKGLKRIFSFTRKIPGKEGSQKETPETVVSPSLSVEPQKSSMSQDASATLSQKDIRGDRLDVKQRPAKKKWQVTDFQVDPVPGKTRFHDIGLPRNIMHAIADLGFQYCTPIQAESLPHLLKGQDLIGHANTGTGKSAVFLLTLLTRLQQSRDADRRGVKALILAPTRELVVQIAKDGK